MAGRLGKAGMLADAWPNNCRDASRVQEALAKKVRICPMKRTVKTVAAVDVGFIGPHRRYTRLVAGVIVYELAGGRVIERRSAICPVTFPYVPGFLSFREAPGALQAIDKLTVVPDVFLIDGQGLAHPRFFGLACHIGVLIDRPTVGCAKSRLIGTAAKALPPSKGQWVELTHADRVVGAVVRTRTNVKPVFVSVGHRVTLTDAVELVLAASPRYRLPEPARIAHNYVTDVARRGVKCR